jgi:hypothetical protein
MSEQRFEMKPYGVRYMCDECDLEMVQAGGALMSYPPKYPHNCLKCGNTENLRERYPTVRWELI